MLYRILQKIFFYERDNAGNVVNNVVHWEARVVDTTAGDVATPTISNLISHSLRNTPDIIFIGEMRNGIEFLESIKAVKSGHILYSSLHASNAHEVIDRMAEEIVGIRPGSDLEHQKLSIASSIDFIIMQRQIEDGSRKILTIDEVCVDGKDWRLNTIFKFVPNGYVEKDEVTGKILKIGGEFKQTGKLSENIIEKILFRWGI